MYFKLRNVARFKCASFNNEKTCCRLLLYFSILILYDRVSETDMEVLERGETCKDHGQELTPGDVMNTDCPSPPSCLVF